MLPFPVKIYPFEIFTRATPRSFLVFKINAFILYFRIFQVEKKIETFYNLLCKESMEREDVEAMEKENLKDCHEIVQMFRGSNGVKKFMITRALTQFTVGSALCLTLWWVYINGLVSTQMPCELHGRLAHLSKSVT